MTSAPETRRGHWVEAIDPDTLRTRDVLLPHRMLHRARQRGKGAIFELAYQATEVLSSPTAIWRGIRRDSDDVSGHADGYLCYAKSLDVRYDYESGDRYDPGERVLLVFLNTEYVVYSVRWEKSDPSNPELPKVDFVEGPRFTERVL